MDMMKWFDTFVNDIGICELSPGGDTHAFPQNMKSLIIEVLSDASNEQFLNGLMASHLRHWGRKEYDNDLFWARSEWHKTDVSYGLATQSFSYRGRGWDSAWHKGITGDIGQIEVKVCYSHLYSGKILQLASQLLRREQGDRDNKLLRRPQLYHGVVWMFDIGQDSLDSAMKAIDAEMNESQRLSWTSPFRKVGEQMVLWPSNNGEGFKCSLYVGLCALKSDGWQL